VQVNGEDAWSVHGRLQERDSPSLTDDRLLVGRLEFVEELDRLDQQLYDLQYAADLDACPVQLAARLQQDGSEG
jgi:hypothetical protein